MGADEPGTLRPRSRPSAKSWCEPKITERNGAAIFKTHGGRPAGRVSAASSRPSSAPSIFSNAHWSGATTDLSPRNEAHAACASGSTWGTSSSRATDIYGDGVNVAARLEGLAEPGGLCVSSTVHDHVEGKLDIAFEDHGTHRVKNIAREIHVWRWAPTKSVPARFGERSGTPAPSEKPSIAVLPFDNMSGDAEQEYFSDGVTEDIITELSRYPDFVVIARNSTFIYKNRTVDHKEVARDLGVQFVLEGSVRRGGDRVRISAQLIDASTGAHLWAERYDRTLDDIFAVQDEITGNIVGALGETLQDTRINRARRKDPQSLDAYDRTLQAWAHFKRFSKEDNAEARRLADAAIALAADYARAHAILAWTHLMDFSSRWVDDPDEALGLSYEAARKAVSLDDHNAYAYLVLGACETWLGRHDQAIANMRRAIELNPNDADAHAHFANHLVFAGRADEAVGELEKAMRVNPHYPASYLQFLGRAYFTQRRFEEAESAFERAVTLNPGWPWAHLVLAATRASLGKIDEAKAGVVEARRISPALTLAHVPKAWPFKNAADLDRLVDLLREAGLPE